jgi:hypothetical protein
MKRFLLVIAILAVHITTQAQKMKPDDNLQKRIGAIEDRLALKNLVDVFSTLADQKETQKQTLLFTEDATSETYINSQVVSSLKGRKQIGDAFAAFLNNFETVYHINGQQTVTLNGDKATGTSYCLVTLIGQENGVKMKTTIGAYYQDEFVRSVATWLIAKRKATFAWQDKQEVK